MARRRKRSSSRRKAHKAAHCKVVSVNGKRRKLCWSARGRLTSNKKA